jgi:hypothetical protein
LRAIVERARAVRWSTFLSRELPGILLVAGRRWNVGVFLAADLPGLLHPLPVFLVAEGLLHLILDPELRLAKLGLLQVLLLKVLDLNPLLLNPPLMRAKDEVQVLKMNVSATQRMIPTIFLLSFGIVSFPFF